MPIDPKPPEPQPPVDLIDTVKTPDPDLDSAAMIEEEGEPFENSGV